MKELRGRHWPHTWAPYMCKIDNLKINRPVIKEMSIPMDIPFLTSLLSIEYKLGKPADSIITKIQGLKGLIELESKTNWRTGVVNSQYPMKLDTKEAVRGAIPRVYGTKNTPESKWRRPVVITENVSSGQNSEPKRPTFQGNYHGRYVSKFKKEEELDNKILQNIILSKLNKFSETTYADIREFIYQILGSNETDLAELIRDFMQLVFRKGIQESMYCSLYAKLLCELAGRYPVLLEEMTKLQMNYMNMFHNSDQEHDTNKTYRQGYSQFIAELVAFDCLEIHILKRIFQTILQQILLLRGNAESREHIDEYVDCMSRMSAVLKNKTNAFSTQARKELQEVLTDFLLNTEPFPGISTKSKFICMNIRDILQIVAV